MFLVDRRGCSSVFIGECVEVCSRHTPTYSPILCIYNYLSGDEPMRFEICKRRQKLNINLEDCAFRWFISTKIDTLSFGIL